VWRLRADPSSHARCVGLIRSSPDGTDGGDACRASSVLPANSPGWAGKSAGLATPDRAGVPPMPAAGHAPRRLTSRRSATRTAGGAAWPGDAFVRFSPGGAPRVQFPSQVCSHAPGGRVSPSATPRLPFGCLSITGHFHRLVAALSLPLRGRDRIVRRLRLPGFSRCVIRPRRFVGRPILPWALVLIQGFGHNIMCISRPSRPRESPAPAPGFPGLSAHGFTAPRWCRLPDSITGSIRLPGRYPGVAGPSACYVADALPTRRC
jgi:hypothetical protein